MTLYTGLKDNDESTSSKNFQSVVLPYLKNWKFEEFTNKGFKIRIEFINPLLISQSPYGKDKIFLTFVMPELF